MNDLLEDLRNGIAEYISDVEEEILKTELLQLNHGQMEQKAKRLEVENEKLSENALSQVKALADVKETLAQLSSDRINSSQEAIKEISSHNQVVQLKYEIEILNSRLKSHERDFHILRNEKERLVVEIANLKRKRIVSANKY